MKVTLTRHDLSDALAIAGQATSQRSALRVLTSLRLTAEDSTLKIMGCDGEMWAEASALARVEEPGAICVAQKLLAEIVAALGENDVTLSLEGTHVFLRSGESEWRLMALPADEFPEAPEVSSSSSLQLPFGELVKGINGVSFAVSDDSTRATLTGVHFSYDGTTLTLVATDTHRMVVYRIHREGIGSSLTAIVPEKALRTMKMLALDSGDEITVEFDDTRLLVQAAGARIVSQLLSGTYPAWERVVPSSSTRSWTLDRQELIDHVSRAMIIARDSANRVRFSGSGDSVLISARSEDKGEGKEHLACISENGEIEIAFNGRYVLDALRNMQGEGIRAEMTEAARPAVIRPVDRADDHFCVVMPMALG
jgi:DNA polymerase-3 subunit beta